MPRSTRLVILIKNIYTLYGRKLFLLPVTYFPTNLVYPFTLRVTRIKTRKRKRWSFADSFCEVIPCGPHRSLRACYVRPPHRKIHIEKQRRVLSWWGGVHLTNETHTGKGRRKSNPTTATIDLLVTILW